MMQRTGELQFASTSKPAVLKYHNFKAKTMNPSSFLLKMSTFWCILFLFTQQAQADIWRIMPGQANDIAIGVNGQIWAIGNTPADGSFNVLKWNGTAWEAIDGGGTRIAVHPNGMPWVVNNGGQVWRRDGSRWVSMSAAGAANDIGIGANGQVWIVTRTSTAGGFRLQYLDNRDRGNWTFSDGGGTRISVSPDGQPWLTNNIGQISERKNGTWVPRPGAATDIAVGANGVVWAIGNNSVGGGSFGVHRWDGNSRWDAVDGGGTQIAVDHFGRPIITNHLKEIYRREYTPNTLSATPSVSALNMNYFAAGRISAICVNPNDPNHVIAAGESGGLFETTNARSATRTWRHLSGFDEFAVTDILMLPITGSSVEVYVTCSDSYKNPATTTPFIFKRGTTAGASWTRVTFTASTNVSAARRATYRLVKSKTNNTLYAAGNFGVATKPEGSDTWSLLGMPPGSGVTALETMADGTLIVASITGATTTVYYRPGGSSSWIPATCSVAFPNLNVPGIQRFALKADPAGQIVMISRYTGTGVQLYGSVDNGRNWTPFRNQWGTIWVATLAGGSAGGIENVIPIFNTSRSRLEIYVSNAENFFYGYSNGATAQAALTNALNNAAFPWLPGMSYSGGVGFNAGHTDTRHLLFLEGTPRKVLITSDGGITVQDVTSDNLETFPQSLENTNSGLNALQIYNMTGNGRELFLGTHDNSYGYNSSGDGGTWSNGGGTEGFFISNQGVGYDNPWNLFGLQNSFGKMTGSFTLVNECDPAGSPGRWNSPTPGQGSPIWFGSNIYIQDDGAATGGGFKWKITYNNGCNWENLPNSTYSRADPSSFFSSSANSPFNLYVPISNGPITTLARYSNPLNRDVTNIWQYPFMTGLDGGIARVGGSGGFLSNSVVAVNPSNPNHLLACEVNTGRLKVSNNGGHKWSEVTNFTNTYTDSGRYALKSANGSFGIWSIEFSPFDPQIVLLGTVARGVFISRDGGATWSRLNADGMFMVTDFYWKNAREVFVSTYGRGLFRIAF